MPTIYHNRDISSLSNRKIFVDTNILIYQFCQIAGTYEVIKNSYTKVFSLLLQNKIDLVLDFTVLSEFVNRYLRIAYELYIKQNNININFYFKKDYKPTQDYSDNLRILIATIKNDILPYVEWSNYSSTKTDIDSFLNILQTDKSDFNDLHITQLCKTNNYILMTNDLDFKNMDLDILTTHPTY